METDAFRLGDDRSIPAVTAAEMAEVDRVAVDEVGLQLLQMMENAGRNLATHVRGFAGNPVVIVAGNGGNGGGGLACARHLANRGIPVELLLDRPAGDLTGAAEIQFGILESMNIPAVTDPDALCGSRPRTVIDALIGYGLSGQVRGVARDHIEWLNRQTDTVVSLDVPSGLDATTGDVLGVAVQPDQTVTLALPKTGLTDVCSDLFLADIAIPAEVYDRVGITPGSPFTDDYIVNIQAY
ncbi:MAG: NAD(P)H-hydrate epimerase [Salinirussus sp.]